jgi:hypothetical protein
MGSALATQNLNVEDTPNAIVVVLNWFDEVRERAPRR